MISYLSYSLFGLLNEYYTAKKHYYAGTKYINDWEFDALEKSITAIHGPWALRTYGCVGYEETKHSQIRERFEKVQAAFKKEVNNEF